jgi:hypothetical protein
MVALAWCPRRVHENMARALKALGEPDLTNFPAGIRTKGIKYLTSRIGTVEPLTFHKQFLRDLINSAGPSNSLGFY